MCGLAGFISPNFISEPDAQALGLRMTDAIAHRGPDDKGLWIDCQQGVLLGHRRLSILDLSSAGHQPMISPSGRYVIVFNGEIYNHMHLRAILEREIGPFQWRGHSDTETLLACIDAWGLEKTLKGAVGMFAMALWDRFEALLYLARDRMGEKPLYYGWQKDVFLFGSELKAIRAHSAFAAEIDRNAIALQVRYGYIPTPYSIYVGIQKLLPGTYLCISPNGERSRFDEPVSYWSFQECAEVGVRNPYVGSDEDAVLDLEKILRESVHAQMASDVPLGAFLSGGVDSSTVAALMQAQSKVPIKTFTIGFNDDSYNEAEYAKAVAAHLGTEHTELYFSPDDALDMIPKLGQLYDEPFSDASQLPTFLVSQMTRRHVAVSLSGDGGDELFGGYNRYVWTSEVWRRIGRLPPSMKNIVATMLMAISVQRWNRLAAKIGGRLSNSLMPSNLGEKVHKLAGILSSQSPEEIYGRLVSQYPKPNDLVIGALEPETILSDQSSWPDFPDIESRMMFLDTLSYLRDDILVKVDRAAMGVSLETRVPFLDHRVVEFAWRLPLSMKIRMGQGKWILRQVLEKYVPKELMERPKMGFAIPIDAWLRGPLRNWAEALLDSARLRREGYFHPEPIHQKWEEHLSGKRNWQYFLWNILMFQAWLEGTHPNDSQVH